MNEHCYLNHGGLMKTFSSVYPQATFDGILTNFEAFIPGIYKRGLIKILLHRSFRLCCNYKNLQPEIETWLRFKHNSYTQNFLNYCVKTFLNKSFIQKDLSFIVSNKKELWFAI